MVPEAATLLGFENVAHSYKTYADQRRDLRVSGRENQRDTTDNLLMVTSLSEEATHPFNRARIAEDLAINAGLTIPDAKAVAKRVETRLVHLKTNSATTGLIRELARNEMMQLGLNQNAARYSDLIIPKANILDLLFNKAVENSNIAANNPGAFELSMAKR